MNGTGRSVKVGLTGGFGCGKSTVGAVFAGLGAKVVDADRLARDLLLPGTSVHDAVVREFGDGILDPGGRIDRRRLAAEVFRDPSRRTALEKIVHPPVLAALREELSSGPPVRVAEVPLLYEVGAAGLFDLVVAVLAEPGRVADRVAAERLMSRAEIRARLESQIAPEEKARRADYVVCNNDSPEATRLQVERIYRELIEKIQPGGLQ
jgi:dephospho-CoA kinase